MAAVPVLADASPEQLASLQARMAPPWLTRGIIYQVWLRGFTPEGTLRAATARLPSVAELGVTVVYLCPIMLADDDPRPEFWSPRQRASGTNNPRNPYRIKDYNQVDPEYGSEADLHAFVDTAHALGLRVLFDLVYFHTGPTSVLVREPEFCERDAAGKIVTGQWNFPRLNFKSRPLREYLVANMVHWVKDFHVDGFRCDVADAIPLDFWEEARARLDPLRRDLVMLSEGERAADQVKAFDLNYGFSWYDTSAAVAAGSRPASSLRDLWETQCRARPRGARFMRYTENHDLVNDMQRAAVVFSQRGAAAMSVINFTLDGVPLVYNGQEIGDTSPQSIYARWPVRWEAACLPKPTKRLAFYRKLCRLRRAEQALGEGKVVWLEHNQPDAIVAFLRHAGDERIVTVASLSNRRVEVEVKLPDHHTGSYTSLLQDGAFVTPEDGTLSLNLEGFGYFVGKRQ